VCVRVRVRVRLRLRLRVRVCVCVRARARVCACVWAHPHLMYTLDMCTLDRFSQLVKKFPHIMEPKDSFSHSQVSTNCSYPEPD